MYALLFLVGFFGFLGMAGMSFLHSGHDSHTGNHGSTGEALGGVKALGHGHGPRVHHGPRVSHKGAKGVRGAKRPWWLISPVDVFALCMGAGAAGELLKRSLTPSLLAWAAVVGALVFNLAVVKPLLGSLLRFGSRESEGLEGQVARPAEALTRFDSAGRGLVRLTMDGQFVQLMATLEPGELAQGVRVAKGDEVLVVGVDGARNTCRVNPGARVVTPVAWASSPCVAGASCPCVAGASCPWTLEHGLEGRATHGLEAHATPTRPRARAMARNPK